MSPAEYAGVRAVHLLCAGISIGLFAARGSMQIAGVDWRRWRWLRFVPHLNDTVLLLAAITLAVTSQQYPLAQTWLSAKVLALVLYVAAGSIALRADTPPRRRRLAFAVALATVAYIVLVATTRSATLHWW